jgi:hypothetical protein
MQVEAFQVPGVLHPALGTGALDPCELLIHIPPGLPQDPLVIGSIGLGSIGLGSRKLTPVTKICRLTHHCWPPSPT